MKKLFILLFFLPVLCFSQSMAITSDASGHLKVTNIDVPVGNTITNTTSEVAFATTSPPIPSSMWYVGKHIRLLVGGLFNSAVVVPSVTGKVKLTSSSGTVVIGNTGGVVAIGSLTNKQWYGYLDIVVHSLGVSGTIDAQGCLFVQTAGTSIPLPIVNTADITIDTTVPQTFSLTAQWNTASTSNSITLKNFILDF